MGKIRHVLAGVILLALAAWLGNWSIGAATAVDDRCESTPAWTETVNHPEQTHVVHHEAGTHVVHHDAETEVVHHPAEVKIVHHDAVPGTPDLWWAWSPKCAKGYQGYTPSFPNDKRGKWVGPYDTQGPTPGTYGTWNESQGGSGQASWFHREKGTDGKPAWEETIVIKEAWDEVIVIKEAWDETVVDAEAWDEVVVDAEAYTEVIRHPAVNCSDEPKTPETHRTPEKRITKVPTIIHSGL